MNIHKLIEEELNSVLKEEQGTPAAQAPKEKIFPNSAIGKCKKAGQTPPNSVGVICVQNNTDPNKFDIKTMEHFEWADKSNIESAAVKTSDPALIKKYSAPKTPRIKFSQDILKLQMEINKWLASSPNNKSEMKRLSWFKGDIAGEDGMWGPNTARAVQIIQASEKQAPQTKFSGKIMPKQNDVIAFTEFLRKINELLGKSGQGEVVPLAKPEAKPLEPVPFAAAPGPSKEGAENTPFKSGERLTQYVQALVAKGNRDMLKGQKLYYMDGQQKYMMPFDENGKMTKPQPIVKGPLEESKILRNMILKELMSALK